MTDASDAEAGRGADGRSAGFRRASTDDGATLSALAMRAKAFWGYPEDFLEACRRELEYDAGYIARHTVFVLEQLGTVLGFYSLERLDDGEVEMGALFVEPEHIGRGHGRRLMKHAENQARRLDATRILIHGDPHAVGFYLAMGARYAGEVPSGSIPGRMLPLFQLPLDPATSASSRTDSRKDGRGA